MIQLKNTKGAAIRLIIKNTMYSKETVIVGSPWDLRNAITGATSSYNEVNEVVIANNT